MLYFALSHRSSVWSRNDKTQYSVQWTRRQDDDQSDIKMPSFHISCSLFLASGTQTWEVTGAWRGCRTGQGLVGETDNYVSIQAGGSIGSLPHPGYRTRAASADDPGKKFEPRRGVRHITWMQLPRLIIASDCLTGCDRR